MGGELRGRTLGVIGAGGIGGKLVEMIRVFDMNPPLAFDPYLDKKKAAAAGLQLVDLDTLMKQSDFISVNCPLTDETRNLIGSKELSLMKKEAFIINTARGGIIDEPALIKVLTERSIAGYATDVFAVEPPSVEDPLFKLDNVIVAPHCIAWTHDLFREIGRADARHPAGGVADAGFYSLAVGKGALAAAPLRVPSAQGHETVLLVEDEHMILRVARDALAGLGYRVLTAADGVQALDLVGSMSEPVHLLITDVVMPRMGGRELATRLTALRPGMRVLFSSGYTENAIVEHGVLDEGINFLQKPYTPMALARRVRELLDR